MRSVLNWLVGLFGYYVKHRNELIASSSCTLMGPKTLVLFTLGNSDLKISPTPEAIEKLKTEINRIKEDLNKDDVNWTELVWDDTLRVEHVRL